MGYECTYVLWMEQYKTLQNILGGQQFLCYLTDKSNAQRYS